MSKRQRLHEETNALDKQALWIRATGCAERAIGSKILVYERHLMAVVVVIGDNLAPGSFRFARRRARVALVEHLCSELPVQGALPEMAIVENAPEFIRGSSPKAARSISHAS
jgi:hypothetical protein